MQQLSSKIRLFIKSFKQTKGVNCFKYLMGYSAALSQLHFLAEFQAHVLNEKHRTRIRL